jgi:hypothetical protein
MYNNQVERLVINSLVATKAGAGVVILVIPISVNEHGQQF